MAKSNDDDDDVLTPEDIARRALFAAVPKGPSPNPGYFNPVYAPAPGTASALAQLFKGKGGSPTAESFISWHKETAKESSHVTYSSTRGRDTAAVLRRVGDDGIVSLTFPVDHDDSCDINIRLDRFRSVAHAFKAASTPVTFDTSVEITSPQDIMLALHDLPGEATTVLKQGQERWQAYQRPLPGLCSRLVEIYRGKGGSPESETLIMWSKCDDYITFSSCRGRDIAAIARRVGDDGILSFKVPDRYNWPIMILIKSDRFRSMAHAFKAAKSAVGVTE